MLAAMSHTHHTMALLVESPKHQLTCRRVKDSLAKLYNTIQTWNNLSSSSFDALNRLVNVIIEEECLLAAGTSSSSVGETRIRLHGKIIDKREGLFVQLQQSLTAMVSHYYFIIVSIYYYYYYYYY